jgi:hypothetical protein
MRTHNIRDSSRNQPAALTAYLNNPTHRSSGGCPFRFLARCSPSPGDTERLFRHIYRDDPCANELNLQRGFKAMKSVTVNSVFDFDSTLSGGSD